MSSGGRVFLKRKISRCGAGCESSPLFARFVAYRPPCQKNRQGENRSKAGTAPCKEIRGGKSEADEDNRDSQQHEFNPSQVRGHLTVHFLKFYHIIRRDSILPARVGTVNKKAQDGAGLELFFECVILYKLKLGRSGRFCRTRCCIRKGRFTYGQKHRTVRQRQHIPA